MKMQQKLLNFLEKIQAYATIIAVLATLITSIATLITAITTISSVDEMKKQSSEMQRQREESYMPDLFIDDVDINYVVRWGYFGFEYWFERENISEGIPITNLGIGTAKNIQIYMNTESLVRQIDSIIESSYFYYIDLEKDTTITGLQISKSFIFASQSVQLCLNDSFFDKIIKLAHLTRERKISSIFLNNILCELHYENMLSNSYKKKYSLNMSLSTSPKDYFDSSRGRNSPSKLKFSFRFTEIDSLEKINQPTISINK